jgi:GNAT superfamily N-acetyltransferase
LIREAYIEDAEEICAILHDSITNLCARDHGNDQFKLRKWLENKTVDNCRLWIGSASSKLFVAILSNDVVGVIGVGVNGHIHLCYITPRAKARGIGKAMLSTAEDWMKSIGCYRFEVHSTATALGFYKNQGYIETGEPELQDGIFSYPLIKQIALYLNP